MLSAILDQLKPYRAKLVAVSKRRTIPEIRAIYDQGQRDFAENRVQDLLERREALPADIRWQFLTEALMLSLVGGLIGVVAGVSGAWLFGASGDMRTVIVPSSILLAFGSAAAVGVFFGYFPATKAAQLDPIEALRHE